MRDVNIGAFKLENHFCWQGILQVANIKEIPYSFETKMWGILLGNQKLFIGKNGLVRTKLLLHHYLYVI